MTKVKDIDSLVRLFEMDKNIYFDISNMLNKDTKASSLTKWKDNVGLTIKWFDNTMSSFSDIFKQYNVIYFEDPPKKIIMRPIKPKLGGQRKIQVKYTKSTHKHIDSKGIERTVYVKSGANYVRVKSAKTGKFMYKKVGE